MGKVLTRATITGHNDANASQPGVMPGEGVDHWTKLSRNVFSSIESNQPEAVDPKRTRS